MLEEETIREPGLYRYAFSYFFYPSSDNVPHKQSQPSLNACKKGLKRQL
jgi:hypothetical protein